MDSILQFFQGLQTDRLIALMNEMHLGDLIHSPWFLGSVAALAVIALLLRWRVFLAIILGLTGFAWLISYTLDQGASLDSPSNPTLLVFVGGGAFIVGLFIYLLFIKSD